MYKIIYLAMIAVGILLTIYGLSASKSINSKISRLFTGVPTDQTIWLLAVGLALSIGGFAGIMRIP